jgi:hypothetical protein
MRSQKNHTQIEELESQNHSVRSSLHVMSLRFTDVKVEEEYISYHIQAHLKSTELRTACVLLSIALFVHTIFWGTPLSCWCGVCHPDTIAQLYNSRSVYSLLLYYSVPTVVTWAIAVVVFSKPLNRLMTQRNNWQMFMLFCFIFMFVWRLMSVPVSDIISKPNSFQQHYSDSISSVNSNISVANLEEAAEARIIIKKLYGYRMGIFTMIFYSTFMFLSG